MKYYVFSAFLLLFFSPFAVGRTYGSKIQSDADRIVERMRGYSMQMQATARSDGRIDSSEQRRRQVTTDLHKLGKESIPALIRTLTDADVQMRRNTVLILIDLAGGYSTEAQPKIDIREAIPSLIKATEDRDPQVRGWAAHALAEIGPDAREAVPSLIKLLKDSEVGPRNNSCMALGRIGPAAKYALPALREALNDPNKDVRGFARKAIDEIEQ